MDTKQIIDLIQQLPEADQPKREGITNILVKHGLDPVVKYGIVYLFWCKSGEPCELSEILEIYNLHWYPSVPADLEIADEATNKFEDFGFDVGIDEDLTAYICLKDPEGDRRQVKFEDVHRIRSKGLSGPTIKCYACNEHTALWADSYAWNTKDPPAGTVLIFTCEQCHATELTKDIVRNQYERLLKNACRHQIGRH